MLRRLKQLFKRYADIHGRLHFEGFDLVDANGTAFGVLEDITLKQGRLFVEGWADAEMVGLVCGSERRQKAPNLVRDDLMMQGHRVSRSTPGFVIDLPFEQAHKELRISKGTERYVFALPEVTTFRVKAMHLRLILPFLRDGAQALPSVLRWTLRQDLAARAKVKATFGFNAYDVTALTIESDILTSDAGRAGGGDEPTITIIIPVYNAFEVLGAVLERVVAHTDLPYRMIMIEDASPDERVRPFLQAWLEKLPEDDSDRVQIIENETNLGFVASVNIALKEAVRHDDHVVLLNSDAFVPAGWASRLIAPFSTQESVASVTPMSNDAEIFTVPVICKRNDLKPGQGDALDEAAALLSSTSALVEAPTGVGFCMAMNIDYLKLEPQLDTAFGKGYGEEVDWCCRVKQRHGGRHLGLARLFVEHRGGTSFGNDEKIKLIQANSKILTSRYPDYDQSVLTFMQRDPLNSHRLALSLTWAGLQQVGPVPVYLAHYMGGGAEHFLQQRVEADLTKEGQAAAVILRVGGEDNWHLEVHTQFGVIRGASNDTGLIVALLETLPKRHMVYSCGVGGHNAMEIPAILTTLATGEDHSLEVLFHDFLPLSPSYTLLDQDGIYRGVPKTNGRQDPAHQYRLPTGQVLPLSNWRKAWGEMLVAADHIIVFSMNSAEMVAQAYPESHPRIRVQPHDIQHAVPVVAPGKASDNVPVIGVLGNIGMQKGVEILQALSKHLARTGEARLVVIGDIDSAYTLARPSLVHGRYKVEDIPGLVARYGISQWLMPSIWPETFSYATHEAIATGLPVWSFDIGAQGDAVTAAKEANGVGGTIPLSLVQKDVAKLVEAMLSQKLT